MDLLIPSILLTMAMDYTVCQVFDNPMDRTGNVGVAPEGKPPFPSVDGVSYAAGFQPGQSTPRPQPGPGQNYRWQFSPDSNSIVDASVDVGESPRASGTYEVVHPDTQTRSRVNYVADERGYRANFMLGRT